MCIYYYHVKYHIWCVLELNIKQWFLNSTKLLFTVQMMNKRRFCTLTFKADLHSQVNTTVSVTSSASRSYRVLHSSGNWPITGQYSGLMWSELTNYMSVFRSLDQYWPITGQYSGHVTIIDQSELRPELHGLQGVALCPRAWCIMSLSS